MLHQHKYIKTRRGFTLIEISVVSSIIALLALVTIPALLNYQKTSKLRNEARLLATNLRYAQQLAITEQNIYQLKLLPDSSSYQIINETSGAVIKTVQLLSEVRISEIDNLTSDIVKFNPTGAAAEVGYIYLANTKNQTSTIEIKPSGYVQVTD